VAGGEHGGLFQLHRSGEEVLDTDPLRSKRTVVFVSTSLLLTRSYLPRPRCLGVLVQGTSLPVIV
jgi:hypothetical protein